MKDLEKYSNSIGFKFKIVNPFAEKNYKENQQLLLENLALVTKPEKALTGEETKMEEKSNPGETTTAKKQQEDNQVPAQSSFLYHSLDSLKGNFDLLVEVIEVFRDWKGIPSNIPISSKLAAIISKSSSNKVDKQTFWRLLKEVPKTPSSFPSMKALQAKINSVGKEMEQNTPLVDPRLQNFNGLLIEQEKEKEKLLTLAKKRKEDLEPSHELEIIDGISCMMKNETSKAKYFLAERYIDFDHGPKKTTKTFYIQEVLPNCLDFEPELLSIQEDKVQKTKSKLPFEWFSMFLEWEGQQKSGLSTRKGMNIPGPYGKELMLGWMQPDPLWFGVVYPRAGTGP